MPIPMDQSDFWRMKGEEQTEAMKQKPRPAFPTLDQAYRSNKADLDAKRKAFEQQRREDPYAFTGKDMPRIMTPEEKRRLINRTPHDEGE